MGIGEEQHLVQITILVHVGPEEMDFWTDPELIEERLQDGYVDIREIKVHDLGLVPNDDDE